MHKYKLYSVFYIMHNRSIYNWNYVMFGMMWDISNVGY